MRALETNYGNDRERDRERDCFLSEDHWIPIHYIILECQE